MTRPSQPACARTIVITGAVAAVACILLLTTDYVRARRRAGPDAERISALQAEAQRDRSASIALAAEHDRITRTRRARRVRADVTSSVLLTAAVLFVAGAKWQTALAGGRRPAGTVIPLSTLAASARHLARTLDHSPPRGAAVQGQPAADVDLSAVDAIVRREGTSAEAAIPILQAIQAHYRYLPDAALRRVCEISDVTPAQIAGTSSFYARFRRSPVGDHVVRICHGTACHVSGARQITDELRRALGIPDGADTDPHGLFTVDEVACVGCCSLAPVMMVDDHTIGHLTPATACETLCASIDERPRLSTAASAAMAAASKEPA